jgi:hypothetical protein
MAPLPIAGLSRRLPSYLPDEPEEAPLGTESGRAEGAMSLDDEMIDTPDGPMTWAQWKKKNPIQIPSRRTKGKKLPVKVKRFTGET